MCYKQEEIIYEMKMDQISEQIEELVLDAFLSALSNIKKRNKRFRELEERKDEILF